MHPHPVGPRPGTQRATAAPTRVLVVVALVLALGVAACANTSSKALIGTTTTFEGTTTTAPAQLPAPTLPADFVIPDTRNASIRPVAGKEKPVPIPVRGGTSSVTGTVTGPDGGVGGATVLIERFVGVQSGSIMVAADGAGRFAATGLLGGRYRVRAWLQPSMAAVQSATGFVAVDDHIDLSVTVERHDALTLQLASTVGAMTVGVPAGVQALITQQSVDTNGIVRDTPVPGVSLQLVTSAGVGIEQPNPAVTGANGRATWSVVCGAPGTSYVMSVSSTTPPAAAGANLPACTVPTSTTSSTTTTDPKTTTTTGRGGPGR